MAGIKTYKGVSMMNMARGSIDSDFGNTGDKLNTSRLVIPGTSRRVGRIRANDTSLPSFSDGLDFIGVRNGTISSGATFNRAMESVEYVAQLMKDFETANPTTTAQVQSYGMATALNCYLIADAIEDQIGGSTDGFLNDIFQIMNGVTFTGNWKFWQMPGYYTPTTSIAQKWRSFVTLDGGVASSAQWSEYEVRKRYAHANDLFKPLILQNMIMRPSGIYTFALQTLSPSSYTEYQEYEYTQTGFTTSKLYLKKDPSGQFQSGGLKRCPVFNGSSSTGYIPDNAQLGHGEIAPAYYPENPPSTYTRKFRCDLTSSSTYWFRGIVHQDVKIPSTGYLYPPINLFDNFYWSPAPYFKYRAYDETGSALTLSVSNTLEYSSNGGQTKFTVLQRESGHQFANTTSNYSLAFRPELSFFATTVSGQKILKKGQIALGVPGNILYHQTLYASMIMGGALNYNNLHDHLTDGGAGTMSGYGLGLSDSDVIEWRVDFGLRQSGYNEWNLPSGWSDRFDIANTGVTYGQQEAFGAVYGQIDPLVFDFAVTP